jgi:uncharacterized protein
MASEPLRTCVGCRTVRPKAELLRLVRQPNGTVCMDPKGRCEGRGVYVCPNADCLNTSVKRKALERGLKGPVTADAVEMLRAAIVTAL